MKVLLTYDANDHHYIIKQRLLASGFIDRGTSVDGNIRKLPNTTVAVDAPTLQAAVDRFAAVTHALGMTDNITRLFASPVGEEFLLYSEELC